MAAALAVICGLGPAFAVVVIKHDVLKHNLLTLLPMHPNAKVLTGDQQKQLVGEVVDNAVIEMVEVAVGEF